MKSISVVILDLGKRSVYFGDDEGFCVRADRSSVNWKLVFSYVKGEQQKLSFTSAVITYDANIIFGSPKLPIFKIAVSVQRPTIHSTQQ